MFKYYTLLRPVGIGTCPKGFREFVNFPERREVEKGVRAWGVITYDHPLTEEEVRDYELQMVK